MGSSASKKSSQNNACTPFSAFPLNTAKGAATRNALIQQCAVNVVASGYPRDFCAPWAAAHYKNNPNCSMDSLLTACNAKKARIDYPIATKLCGNLIDLENTMWKP